MADYTETINLADYKVGDRWIGISTIGPVTVNGSTPGNALTRVVMNFRLGAASYTLDSDGASPGIVISNAATWVRRSRPGIASSRGLGNGSGTWNSTKPDILLRGRCTLAR